MKINLLLPVLLMITKLCAAQNIGIGVNTPQQKLEVNGAIKISSNDAVNPTKGTMRWNEFKNDFEGFNGNGWVSLTGSKNTWGSQLNYAYETWANNNMLYNDGKELGASMAAYGNRIVSGAPGDRSNVNIPDLGSLRGFTYAEGKVVSNLSLQASTRPSGSRQGSSVAMNETFVVFGAPGDYDRKGAVFVHNYQNPSNYPADIIAPDGIAGDEFGSSVSVDGNYLATSSLRFKASGSTRGKVYVFSNLAGNWFNIAAVTGPVASEDFGYAVCMKGDWLMVSAPRANIGNVGTAGKVYIYKRTSGTSNYTLAQTLIPQTPYSFGHFGKSVFMNADTLLVGQHINEKGGNVSLYTLNNGVWNLRHIIDPPAEKKAQYFGMAVHMRNGKIIIGAPASYVYSSLQGAAFIYSYQNNTWQEEAMLVSAHGKWGDAFGTSVALTDDGAWVGSPIADFPNHPGHGRIYFYKK